MTNPSYLKNVQLEVIPHSSCGRWLCVQMKFSSADFETRPDGMRRKTFLLLLVAVKSSSLLSGEPALTTVLRFDKLRKNDIFCTFTAKTEKEEKGTRTFVSLFSRISLVIFRSMICSPNKTITKQSNYMMCYILGGRSDAVT